MHMFCELSEKCYAAVADLRIQQGEDVQTAKTRAAHLKLLSIPRLEIQGLTNTTELEYVFTRGNVANETTKRLQKIQFSDNNRRWIFGTDFLKLPQDTWPKEKWIRF